MFISPLIVSHWPQSCRGVLECILERKYQVVVPGQKGIHLESCWQPAKWQNRHSAGSGRNGKSVFK